MMILEECRRIEKETGYFPVMRQLSSAILDRESPSTSQQWLLRLEKMGYLDRKKVLRNEGTVWRCTRANKPPEFDQVYEAISTRALMARFYMRIESYALTVASMCSLWLVGFPFTLAEIGEPLGHKRNTIYGRMNRIYKTTNAVEPSCKWTAEGKGRWRPTGELLGFLSTQDDYLKKIIQERFQWVPIKVDPSLFAETTTGIVGVRSSRSSESTQPSPSTSSETSARDKTAND